MTEVQPQQNGPEETGKYIDSIDPEDPEYIRQMRRPADVKEDVKQMDERKRVSLIMKTQAFREEMETIISDQLRTGPHPASLLALQQITELLVPQSGKAGNGGMPGSRNVGGASGSGPVIPIADIRGVESLNYTKGEKMLRNRMAAVYRLVDLYNWGHGFKSLVTARISQDHEHFLVAPHGLLYHEVTASTLLKVDMQGEIIDPGSTVLGLNRVMYGMHTAIHAARPDIKALIHVANPAVISISVMNCGLLPLCTEAVTAGEISYYEFPGVLSDQEEKDKLAKALGPINKVLFLRCNGVVVGGETIQEAMYHARNIVSACDIQLQTMPAGMSNIITMSDEERKRACDAVAQSAPETEGGKRRWKRGEMEFEAQMRHLDNSGYRTGHSYHDQLMRRGEHRNRANSEVEIPPAVTSINYYDGETRSPLKHHMERQKKAFKTEWLNTPNTYKREEIEETGTPHPKKITKWVSGDAQGSNVKVDSPNVFAPQGEDPKELKSKYKAIRKEYYDEKIDAGPQSRILEGISWEEAQRIKEGHVSGTSDSTIVVGAASKGIIQRDHQHNAVVYKTYYAPNPFDNMSEDEMQKYKEEVEQKSHGGAGEPLATDEALEPGPDGRLISTEERMEYVRVTQEVAPISEEPRQQVVTTHSRVETSVDEVYPPQSPQPHADPAAYIRRVPSRETNIDEQYDSRGNARVVARQQSAPSQEQQQNFQQPQQVVSTKQKKPKSARSSDLPRSKSERYPKQRQQELVAELKKLSKDDSAMNGDQAVLSSPAKSTSSGEGTLDERSSREASPVKEHTHDSADKSEKKKKKFRIPSFSKKKDKKK